MVLWCLGLGVVSPELSVLNFSFYFNFLEGGGRSGLGKQEVGLDASS